MEKRYDIAFLFDVDGLIAETPHEEAWKAAAVSWGIIQDDFDFTPFYAAHVAGEPGITGAMNILELLHGDGELPYFQRKRIEYVADKDAVAANFRDPVKKEFIDDFVAGGQFRIFEDTASVIFGLKKLGYSLGVVSGSEYAGKILSNIEPYPLARSLGHDPEELGIKEGSQFIDLFDAEALGAISYWPGKTVEKINHYAMAYGKLLGAIGSDSENIPRIVVFEDAPKGIAAVKKLGFYAVGISRISTSGVCLATEDDLYAAGADIAYNEEAFSRASAEDIVSGLERLA
ncbi:hypothetical protein JXC34_01485 [Candidatus Woesearchaeota archaeon]|nr:hypothetical protein [Candidatus Woesearchaeota archaeon]